MRDVFKIFIRDLKKIKNNSAAILIMIGLCILPSLYAWINIIACWDPYANTGNLPVAIVNKDSGAIVNGEEINIGDKVEEQLRTDTAIKWEFQDEWLANNDLYAGKYYAIIEIPEDFSRGIVSLTTANPKKPSIIYKANEKKNAIASKITNVAKDKLTKKIKTNFVETVNKEAFNEFNRVGEHLDTNRDKILGLKDVVAESNENLELIKDTLSASGKSSEEMAEYFKEVKDKLPLITDQINSLQSVIKNTKSVINSQKDQLVSINNDLNSDITKLQASMQKENELINKLKNISDLKEQSEILQEIMNNLSSMSDIVDKNITSLDKENLGSIGSNLEEVKSKLSIAEDKIKELNEAGKLIDTSNITSIESLSGSINSEINKFANNFYISGSSTITNKANLLNNELDKVSSILDVMRVVEPQLQALSSIGLSSAESFVSNTEQLSDKISEIQDELNNLSESMNNVDEESINEIIELLGKNPDEVADFISSPIDVEQVDVYGEGIFGVGLTPFYGVLAIWVGALLACAILTTECEDFEDGRKLSMVKKHFGKMILFLSLSFIQSIIMVLGLMFILKVNVVNVPLLFGFTILTSVTFTIIIFTLVSLLGNVGKAVAVVIMVFQIAGAGGIYPIQTNPEIFGILYPLWPFTYAINGFREAISGEVWINVVSNVVPLLSFCLVFLLLAVLKKPFHKVTHFMEEKFKEAEM